MKLRPVVYVMVGISGSGKSTCAASFAKGLRIHPVDIISSDEIRKEVHGDANNQKNPELIFNIYYQRALLSLFKGHYVILDATNLTPKTRKIIFKRLFGYDCVAIWIDADMEKAFSRNLQRERVVPREVVEKQYQKLIPPTKEEGFKRIIHITEEMLERMI